MTTPLYFDNNATTPVDPRVLKAMLPYFTEHFGNAESSQHAYGWKAKLAVDQSREQTAALLGANPADIIFTCGATESINIAIMGLLEATGKPSHIITSAAEHKATLEVFARAAKFGHETTVLPVNSYGQIEIETLKRAIRPSTLLVSLLHANNEIGSLNPIADIGKFLRERGIAFHVDAAQTVGKEPISVEEMKIDLLSLSAHKFYGPKGAGALYVRRPAIHLLPIMAGGGQERGLRSGTHNVPGIVGLGKACELAQQEMPMENNKLGKMRDQIIRELSGDTVELNGHATERVCNNVHFTVRGIGSDTLLEGLSDIAFSTASACSAGGESHVLKAIGKAANDPLVSSMRFGLGRFTTEAEVSALITKVRALVQNAPDISKAYSGESSIVAKHSEMR